MYLCLRRSTTLVVNNTIIMAFVLVIYIYLDIDVIVCRCFYTFLYIL